MIRPVRADGRIETGGAFTPIHRPRIVDRIASAATQRIVLIIAPAGYGKSVALRQYLDELQDPHVRFDVHPEHATLLGFVRGLAEALIEIAPDVRKTVSVAYEKSASSKSLGADLAMWMHAHIKTFVGTIAVDDLHVAENDPEISKFLVSLIDRTKGRAQWIIASRSSLDLPVGSWLAYGDMDLAVDEQDLRFTIEESRQTAKQTRVGVGEQELDEILKMTEGWPTAMSFALRSSTRSVDLRNIAANTREMVYRYLAEQVYESLEDDERDLLHFIGYLPEISLEVLRIAGFSKSKGIIEKLRDRVAFIYPERPGVYRCHDLFREFLQHQIELNGDVAAMAVQRAAAAALEESGSIAQALTLYVEMRAEEDVLRILCEHGFKLAETAHGDVVSAALESLSAERRASAPIVLGLRAQREADAGHFDKAESLFQRAISLSCDDVLGADLRIRLGTMLFNQGKDVIGLLKPVAEGESLRAELRASAISLLVPAYAFANDEEAWASANRRAEELARACESDELRARLYLRMGIAAVHLQHAPHEVVDLFSKAQTLAMECGLFVTAAAAFGGLTTAAILYEDDATKAVWYAQQGINTATKAGDRFSLHLSLLKLIDLEARRGNLERLAALERQFAAVTTTDGKRAAFILPERAMAAAWEGRFDEALRLSGMAPPDQFQLFDQMMHKSLEGLYAIGAAKRSLALTIAAETCDRIQTSSFPYLYGQRIAEISRLTCAMVEALGGRLTAAQRILGRKPLCDGPSVDAMRQTAIAICRMMKNPALEADVTEALDQVRAVGWGGIAMVLDKVIASAIADRRAEDAPLTRAELDVLEALAHGQSPKEIAQSSGRSVYTIQAHIQNVIKKLGCSGRHEAMTVARRKGLLKFN